MSLFIQQGDLKTIIKRSPVASAFALINLLFLILAIVNGLILGGVDYIFNPINLEKIGGMAPIHIVPSFLVPNDAVPAYLIPSDIGPHEYYRLLTTMFIHGGVLHFLFNIVFGILILCAGLEKLIGSLKFFAIYIITGILANLFVVYSAIYYVKSIDSLFIITVGASGAIFGVIGVLLYIILFKPNLLTYSDRRLIITLLIINIIFTFVNPTISVAGHFGGLMAGLLIAPLFFMNKKY